MKVRKIHGLYDEEAMPEVGEDKALAATLHVSGYYLAHEPNEACWCGPKIIEERDDDGDVVDFYFLHQIMH